MGHYHNPILSSSIQQPFPSRGAVGTLSIQLSWPPPFGRRVSPSRDRVTEFHPCGYWLMHTCKHKNCTPPRTHGDKRSERAKTKHALARRLFVLARGHRETVWPPTLQTQHLKSIDVYWWLLYKRRKNNRWLFCLLEFLSQNTLICIPVIVGKTQWSVLCLQSGERHSVCKINANKRYCFARKLNPARFPGVACTPTP